jgi:AbrB family looped-hinge helix DNA binding protein
MQPRVSSKGQVVLPSPIRRTLGLCASDPLDAEVESGRIVLTPRRSRSGHVSIVMDPITGFPVLSRDPNAAVLSSKQVEEILAAFP